MNTTTDAENFNEMLARFVSAGEQFLRELRSFSQEELNRVPAGGGWSAGQIARHIEKSTAGFADLIEGPSKPCTRQPDALVGRIEKIFADDSTKMQSPDFAQPETEHYDLPSLLVSLQSLRARIHSAALHLDPYETCTMYELPVLGALTRLEALCFAGAHTGRHARQLETLLGRMRKEA